VVKALCDHSRSQNAALRLNALWALKHYVYAASFKIKKECLEELHSGWLVKLICDDTEDEALFSARARGDKQAGMDGMVDADETMDLDDHTRPTMSPSGATRLSEDSRILRLAESKLAALREAELNPVRKARQDDLDIQEQGLDFIRNLIGGAESASITDSTRETTEMIDHLFNTLGQDRFFSILVQKLKPKYLHQQTGRRGASGHEARVLYPQAKIIEAVVFILVHIAASVPHHRQLVIAQTELLRLLAGLFNSQDREVRVALCHLINNLTWQDDVSDASACSLRAVELKKLGFLTKLESLGQSDDELDVRERAKSALWQMKKGY
jgi:armadillo repeat-containing protein 8